MCLSCTCQRHAHACQHSFLIRCCGRLLSYSRLAEPPRWGAREHWRADGRIAGCLDGDVLRLVWRLPRIQRPGHLIQGHCHLPKAQGALTSPVDLQDNAPGSGRLAWHRSPVMDAAMQPASMVSCTGLLEGSAMVETIHEFRAHPHEGLQCICDAVLLGDGLQAQPHLRHGALIDGDDAVPCACMT